MDNAQNPGESGAARATTAAGDTVGCGCGCASTSDNDTSQNLGQPTVVSTPQNPAGEARENTSSEESSHGCCGGSHGHSESQSGQPAHDSECDTASADDTGEQSCGCCGDGEAEKTSTDEENADAADTGSSCCGAVKTPEDELAEALDSLKRTAAEYANYRRRTERDRAAVGAIAKMSVVEDFLPVMDDLELADRHGDLQGPLKAVNDKLRAAFTKHNVTEFGKPGDEFNPDIHEAVQDTSEGETKVIGTVLRSGYMIGERLIRTAMVVISDPPQQ